MKTAVIPLLVSVILVRRECQAHTPPGRLSLYQQPTVALDPSVTVSVGPSLLFTSGDWVTVTWTGIESWMFPDAFVAAFSPGDVLDGDLANITDVAPIKYQFLSAGEPFPGNALSDEAGQPLMPSGSNAVESLRFRLLNLRDPEGYRFGLFKGGVENPVLVAKTEEAVTFARPLEVMHVHLALTSEENEMRVSWVTGYSSRTPAVRFRHVEIGEDGKSTSWQEVQAQTSSYGRNDMCGAPATTRGFHDPGLLHSAVMADLIPGQPYEYQAGDVDEREWSTSAFFYASPPSKKHPSISRRNQPVDDILAASAKASIPLDDEKGNEENSGRNAFPRDTRWGSEAVKIAVFGDMGTSEVDGTLDAGHSNEPPSIRTVALLKQQLEAGTRSATGDIGDSDVARVAGGLEGSPEPRLGLVLHIGDLSYARGYDAQWDEFLDQISPVASVVPWMVGVGNHERDFPTPPLSGAQQELSYFTGTDSGGDCGVPTAFRFLMPGEAGKPTADTPWYVFDFGPVHFTVMSSEHDFTPGSEQYAFIEEDLAGVDRGNTPWLVFGGHRPMYVNSAGPGAGDCEGEKAEQEHCSNDQPVATLLRSSLEPLLIRYQVDLAVYGHHHSYQRTCKVEGSKCKGMSSHVSLGAGQTGDDEGYIAPVHVVLGMAGMGLSQNMATPSPVWVEYSTDREFGLCTLVADRSKLKLSFILDSDGQVADEMVLTKPSGDSSEDGALLRQNEEARLKRRKDLLEVVGAATSRRKKLLVL